MLESRFRELSSRNGANHKPGIARDTSGNVLPMMAAGFVVLAALVGSAVDMGRAYKAQRRLQSACDAGALAGRRAVGTNGFDTAAQTQANTYFDTNFDDAQQQTTAANTTRTFSSADNGNVVTGTATTQQNTLIMKMFGMQKFDLTVSCQASMGVGNSDVMFVLDNTGSMAEEPDGTSPESGEDSKMQSLQKSMKNFYDTVAASVAGSNARIRYGFVPYSSSVNVGALLRTENSSYIADSMTVQSVQYVNWSTNPINSWTDANPTYSSVLNGSWSHHSSSYWSTENSCTNNQPSDTNWADNGSPSYTYSYAVEADTGHQIKTTGVHQPQTMTDYDCRNAGGNKWWVDKRTRSRTKRSSVYEERTQVAVDTSNSSFASAVLQPRTFDVSSYKTGATVTFPIGSNSSFTETRNVSATWAGCIRERQTTPATAFSFVSLALGITPAAATDLDIDAAPTGSASTKWAPLLPEAAYAREDSDDTYHLIVEGETGANDDAREVLAEHKVSTGCPRGAQLLAAMTEGQFDTYADSLTPTGNTYHDLGILWGARLASPSGIFAANVNLTPPNGGTVSRHMVFMTDGILQPSLDVNSSYGIERNDKIVTGNASSTTQKANHRVRFLALCEAVKARGIRLWVIAFGTSLSSDLITCATDGLASAFEADNAAELDEHFQEIAKQVGELRVIQ